ncbi:hypothetical protein BH23VER1_BH23VER1_07620 [soil metagenome]
MKSVYAAWMLTALSPLAAQVQVVMPIPVPTGMVAPGSAPGAAQVGPPAPAADPTASPPEEKSPEAQRLESFLKLAFDRTPSSQLKLWSGALEGEKEPGPDAGPATPPDPELEAVQRAGTGGEWVVVREFLAAQFPTEELGEKAYRHLLAALVAPPRMTGPPPPGAVQNQEYLEQNTFLPRDIIGIADASPVPLDTELIGLLANILKRALAGGKDPEAFVSRLAEGGGRLSGADAARLLIEAGLAAEAERFLPEREAAIAGSDVGALELLTAFELAPRAGAERDECVARAWEFNQHILDAGALSDDQREAAITRAVELAPQVGEAVGDAWLAASFTTSAERGIEVLAAIGKLAAESRPEKSADARLRKLELQGTAVEALLDHAPERAAEWKHVLDLLALRWLDEAEFSHRYDQSESLGQQMQFDQYGNMFYGANPFQNQNNNGNNNKQPDAIPTGKLLESAPGKGWRALVDPSLRPRFLTVFAELYLKVKEEEKAFPYIGDLAFSRPDDALALANQFVRVWAENHDPNREKRRTSNYMYYYGFSQRADSIPLTRSKQERNLQELADWVKKIGELGVGALDEDVLVSAFTTTHSSAEVYQIEAIEKVFGQTDSLKPETLAALLQTMRANLASIWRRPEIQQQNKTKRTDAEIKAEVLRGYAVAESVLEAGRERHPGSWQLQLAWAATQFDRNNFQKELADDAGFAARKKEAFAAFAEAHRLYATALDGGLPEEDESGDVYATWFYASLGASDLGALRHDQLSDPHQQALIAEALRSLPERAAERHLASFANALSTRITSVNAELKHRYLKAGLAIAGDHKQAEEARKVFGYYNDLVTEIQLQAAVDGSTAVGSDEPFGIVVNLRHTAMIERESGGFAKYLQNQNNNPYAYNYGRPPENYRDKFEEAARTALDEHFEILSVTFQADGTESRGDPEPGWRVTPYAYLLVKARGPQVDTVPTLRLDMDFLDTSGFAVLPIESPKIPIDASPARADPRPFRDLVLTFTLDEREAESGVLGL